ncbi:MAG: glycerol kinase GlpK [Deltaproteobacteria bacterium]|nr:glycerol kinase GlpK [Deltaproteobacteria bacterium]
MPDFILALDQGTTATTALVIDKTLTVRGRASREFPQIYPRPGWVEHNAEAIWSTTCDVMRAAIEAAHARSGEIAAIGITNQRETTVLWERATGRPVANAIVWQCRRTAERCEALKTQGLEDWIRDKTGLVLDPYFSGTKIEWLLDAEPKHRKNLAALATGTVDSYLIYRLTGGKVHATDVTNASRTLLLDIKRGAWDDELLALFNVPCEILPDVRASAGDFGRTKDVPGLPDGIPICGAAGDQQAALFGQTCFDRGSAKCTYGTGAFLLMNTGSDVVKSRSGLLSTIAWRIGRDTTYALEGSAFIAGAAVQWLRDGLGIIGTSAEVEKLAASVGDSGGVFFVPALTGLGAPYWRPDARGVITGITRGTRRAHIARATLEGIAFQIAEILLAMQADSGASLKSLRVDGGAAADNLLMQIQSDLLGVEIVRPALVETTALGAALLAGLGAGVWRDTKDVARAFREDRRFKPAMKPADAAARLKEWKAAVAKA